jgi:acyl-CoA thioesterase
VPGTDRLLDDRLSIERTAPGVYELTADRTWWGHDALFGGYVEALALAAMRAELDDAGMAAATTSVHFFRPFVDGPFRAEVSLERKGRSMANLHARLFSQGRLAGQAIAAFAVRRTRAEAHAIELPPAAANRIGAEEQPTSSALDIPTHAHFDFFPRIGAFRMGPTASEAAARAGRAGVEVGGWVRPRFATAVDESLVMMLQDLWLPAVYHHWREPAVAVSVDITTQFRAELPAGGEDASSGLFVLLRTAASTGGLVDEDCEIWSASGVLLAQGRQMRFVH